MIKHNKKKILISRVFNAPQELVWKAWADPELIKKWWGPKGFFASLIKFDFRVGGSYVYRMQSKTGPDIWQKGIYSTGVFREIVPLKKIVMTDSFSDELGNIINPQTYGMSENMPWEMELTIKFEDLNDKTRLIIHYKRPESHAEFNAMVNSKLEDGWNESLDKMAEVLKLKEVML